MNPLTDNLKCTVVFVNPVEYHGPHLPLSTDYDISLGLFSEMRKRLATTYPNLRFHLREPIQKGCNPAHGPGTEFTKIEELTKILRTECDEILSENASPPDLVLFMTFHGSPAHAAALESAIAFLKTKSVKGYNPFNYTMIKMRDYDPSWVKPFAHLIEDPAFRAHWLRTLPQDFHAGTFETSMVLEHAFEKVKDYKAMPDCADRKPGLFWKLPLLPLKLWGAISGNKSGAREWSIAIDAVHWEKDPHYNGYTGAPRHASKELGAALSEVLLSDYLRTFHEIIRGEAESPKPILQWTLRLS